MKHKHIKKARGNILILFLLLCAFAQAQTPGVWTVPNLMADTSIIREWKHKYALTYTSDRMKQYVHLMEQGNTAVFSAQIDDEIRDMEILGDTAYYCGIGASGVPVVGYFSIADFNAGALNVERVSYATATNYHLNQMEVFKVHDGVHVVLVGDVVSSGGEYRLVADVSHHYPLNIWHLSYYIATDQIEFFDDIAVTQNYVVTAAHKHQAGSIYMRMFKKPATANQSSTNGSIFYTSALPAVYDDIYYYPCDYNVIYTPPECPVWVTSTTGDDIAIACMSRNNLSGDHGFTVKTMTVALTPWVVGNDVLVRLGAQLDTTWNVRDLRYSAISNKLLLLLKIQFPSGSVESVVTVVDNSLPNLMTPYFDNYYTRLHSLDKADLMSNGYMSSGMSPLTQEFTWDLNTPATMNCFNFLTLGSVLNSCKMISFPMAIRPNYRFYSMATPEQFSVINNTLIVKCQ